MTENKTLNEGRHEFTRQAIEYRIQLVSIAAATALILADINATISETAVVLISANIVFLLLLESLIWGQYFLED